MTAIIIKWLFKLLFKIVYRVEVSGLENYHAADSRVLIVANHLSFLDGLLLAVFLPDKPTFAVNSHFAKLWFLKPLFKLATIFFVDPNNPMATKSIINQIKQEKKCVIFPEGRITVTGSLMKVYEGPGLIATRANAQILPVRLDGAQYTPFSRLRGKVRIRWFPKIVINILKPCYLTTKEQATAREQRNYLGIKLHDLMTQMLFDSSDHDKTLFKSLIEQRYIHGKKHIIIEDSDFKPINYGQLLAASFVLGKQISKTSNPGEYLGFMLPNMAKSIITFFAMQAYGRVPVMLNFSAGIKNLLSACRTAKIRKIYTSKQFISLSQLDNIVGQLEDTGIEFIYLEDLSKQISIVNKIIGYLAAKLPSLYYHSINKMDPKQPAVVLFTSGSEGNPKGVVLSHVNLQANRYQLISCMDFGPTDIVFSALPIFHSFGLTGGTLLPILGGIRTFFYPTPLHYRIIPQLIYETNATIMFGTDTFLAGYANFAHPYDFYSIRYVFAGAEKLKPGTRKTWLEKYGVRIFEGYGTTETSPGLSSNTGMYNKPGTVGRLLPGVKYKLESIPGIGDDNDLEGKLLVSGPNVMLGYLLSERPRVLVPAPEYYDTGDIVKFDEQDFMTIVGRVKRFAKIGGEMVSLTAAESYITDLWPNYANAIISLPDPKKGESLLLVTENPDAELSVIVKYAKQHGLSELAIPKKMEIIKKLPRLATGKVDYVAIKDLYAL